MMDEQTIRTAIEEIQAELDHLETRQQALMTAQAGLEALLGLRVTPPTAQLQLETYPPDLRVTKPKGTVSLRSAVKQVVKDARGHPLHAKEILHRARSLGAITAAKNPIAIIDLVMTSLRNDGNPVEKVEPRTWRWTGTIVTRDAKRPDSFTVELPND